MKIKNIKVATNGFVFEDTLGNVYVTKTLAEAAALLENTNPGYSGYTQYAEGYNDDLRRCKNFVRMGQKIEAIKLLRNCFTPRLALKEAKELVEVLCEC